MASRSENYGRYLLKKASHAVQHNSASWQDVSSVENQNKHARSSRAHGVSHSVLYNREKWDTTNDEENMEDISISSMHHIPRQGTPRPLNRLTICDSPESIRINRSIEMASSVASTRSVNIGNFLRPYGYTTQSSSDSRLPHSPRSPVLKDYVTRDRLTIPNSTRHYREVESRPQSESNCERDSHIIRLNSTTDVESCYSDANEMKCRYCFGGALGWIVKEPLISPCWCSGSLAYVHRSCLEKWLTTRKQSSCDLCKYEFLTTKKYKPLREIQFSKIEGEDVFLLIVSVLIYVTFIFQFLAAAYIGLIAEHIPGSVLAVSMTGLGLGLFWFLIGCIALTVLTYTSDYWTEWRQMNKRISIVMSSINKRDKKAATEEESSGLTASETQNVSA